MNCNSGQLSNPLYYWAVSLLFLDPSDRGRISINLLKKEMAFIDYSEETVIVVLPLFSERFCSSCIQHTELVLVQFQ